MNVRRVLIWSSIPLGLILAYLLKDYVRAYVLDPFIYLYRIVGLVYRALPQALWWGLFLLVLIFIAIRSLRGEREVNPRKKPEPASRASRALVWANLLRSAGRGNYSRWLLAREMGNLTLRIIAHQERLSPGQARNLLQSGKITLPPGIQEYVAMGLDAPSFRHYSDLLVYMRANRYRPPQEIAPETMIEYLENRIQMEAPRDNPSQ